MLNVSRIDRDVIDPLPWPPQLPPAKREGKKVADYQIIIIHSVTYFTIESRYDRQLRLWGDHGQVDMGFTITVNHDALQLLINCDRVVTMVKVQAALERASVCLVNAEAVGTEILKSLVLPGLGNFTILDPALVSSSCNVAPATLDCYSWNTF